jgi:hypothetical protein
MSNLFRELRPAVAGIKLKNGDNRTPSEQGLIALPRIGRPKLILFFLDFAIRSTLKSGGVRFVLDMRHIYV